MSKIMSEQHVTTPAVAAAKAAILSKYSGRLVVLKTVLESSDGGVGLVGQRVMIGGWVRSSKEVKKEPLPQAPTAPADHHPSDTLATRDVSCSEILQSRIPFIRSIIKIFGGSSCSVRDKFETVPSMPPSVPPSTAFLQVSDGSCAWSLLVVVDSSIAPLSHVMPTGTCIVAEGKLRHSTFDNKRAVELLVEKVIHIGTVESDKYPLSKKRVALHSLRDIPHFRPRTTTVATVMRIRSSLSLAAHTFPQSHGFHCIQLPIITATDSLGFSNEKFHVAANSPNKEDQPKGSEDISLEAVKTAAKEKSRIIEDLKRTESNKEALMAATKDLQKTLHLASQLEEREKSKSKSGCDQQFFSRESHLTLSGRLHLQSYACCLGNAYDFGPRFRASMNESPKHVAEMWTVEMEMAFSQLEDAMNCAEDYFKFLSKWVLEKCSEDMKFVLKRIDTTSVDRLNETTANSIARITYTEALDVLRKVMDGKKMETKLEWGIAFSTEHLSILADEIYKKPVIIYNYPKDVKPFYARINDDRRTVAAFDMVVPKVGILVSGCENEERLNILNARIKELGLAGEDYEWCLDLRRHGTARLAGFSFAFDLMVLFATGLVDVRDAIPFPRTRGKILN